MSQPTARVCRFSSGLKRYLQLPINESLLQYMDHHELALYHDYLSDILSGVASQFGKFGVDNILHIQAMILCRLEEIEILNPTELRTVMEENDTTRFSDTQRLANFFGDRDLTKFSGRTEGIDHMVIDPEYLNDEVHTELEKEGDACNAFQVRKNEQSELFYIYGGLFQDYEQWKALESALRRHERELLREGEITIRNLPYGGFELVARPIAQFLDDSQTEHAYGRLRDSGTIGSVAAAPPERLVDEICSICFPTSPSYHSPVCCCSVTCGTSCKTSTDSEVGQPVDDETEEKHKDHPPCGAKIEARTHRKQIEELNSWEPTQRVPYSDIKPGRSFEVPQELAKRGISDRQYREAADYSSLLVEKYYITLRKAGMSKRDAYQTAAQAVLSEFPDIWSLLPSAASSVPYTPRKSHKSLDPSMSPFRNTLRQRGPSRDQVTDRDFHPANSSRGTYKPTRSSRMNDSSYDGRVLPRQSPSLQEDRRSKVNGAQNLDLQIASKGFVPQCDPRKPLKVPVEHNRSTRLVRQDSPIKITEVLGSPSSVAKFRIPPTQDDTNRLREKHYKLNTMLHNAPALHATRKEPPATRIINGIPALRNSSRVSNQKESHVATKHTLTPEATTSSGQQHAINTDSPRPARVESFFPVRALPTARRAHATSCLPVRPAGRDTITKRSGALPRSPKGKSRAYQAYVVDSSDASPRSSPRLWRDV
ncbi:Nn.00g080560.m01.CDS01 [Neocucurbitaria sp. VM-36]